MYSLVCRVHIKNNLPLEAQLYEYLSVVECHYPPIDEAPPPPPGHRATIQNLPLPTLQYKCPSVRKSVNLGFPLCQWLSPFLPATCCVKEIESHK